jgi:hypothetical protein
LAEYSREAPATKEQREKLLFFGCTFDDWITQGQAADALAQCTESFPATEVEWNNRLHCGPSVLPSLNPGAPALPPPLPIKTSTVACRHCSGLVEVQEPDLGAIVTCPHCHEQTVARMRRIPVSVLVACLVTFSVALLVGGVHIFKPSIGSPFKQSKTEPTISGAVAAPITDEDALVDSSTLLSKPSATAKDLVEQGRIAFEAHQWDRAAEVWNRLLLEYPNDSRAELIAKLTPERPITANTPKVMFCLSVAGACKTHTGDVKDMVLALMMLTPSKPGGLDSTTKEAATIIMMDLKLAYHDGRMTADQREAASKIFGADLFTR